MKRLAKDTETPFWQSKPPIYLGPQRRESLHAQAPHPAGDGLASGNRVNLLERYDYPEILATKLLPELATARGLAEAAGQGLLVEAHARQTITDAILRIPRRRGLHALSAFIEVLGHLELHQGSMLPLASRAARSAAASHTEQDRRIARVIEWMHANLAHELRLGDAARLAHISPSAFSRYFSREVGKR
jgi:hypothetical protein